MILLTTHTALKYLQEKFPHMASAFKNGVVDESSMESIGVQVGSDTRSDNPLAVGGIDCTTTMMLPININIRWHTNQQECDTVAAEIYEALLLERDNFMMGDKKIACIQMLDACPIQLGRDNKNVCLATIRANIHYYV